MSVVIPVLEETIAGGLLAYLTKSIVDVTVGTTTLRETSRCTYEGLKGLFSRSPDKFQVYPALAVTGRVLSGAKNIFQVMRHGIIVRTTSGKYYYIGGKSEYWAGGRAFHAFQGTTEFTLNPDKGDEKSPIWGMMRNAKSNIIVLQVRGTRLSAKWANPKPMEGCSEPVVGWFAEQVEKKLRGGFIMDYLPYYVASSVGWPGFARVPGSLVYESGGKLTTDPLQGTMRANSGMPPVPHFVALYGGMDAEAALANMMMGVLKGSLDVYRGLILYPGASNAQVCRYINGDAEVCQTLEQDNPSVFGKSFPDYRQALIGAPVFSAFACPSGCKAPGLVGLVYGMADDKVFDVYIMTETGVIAGPPSQGGDYTDDAIRQYANALGVLDILELSTRYVESANRAEAELVSALGLTPALASAIIALVPWYEDWTQTFNEARKIADVVNKVKEELKATGATNLIQYVDQCAQEAIEELGEVALDEQELRYYIMDCLRWRSNMGTYTPVRPTQM